VFSIVLFQGKYLTSEVHVDFNMLYLISRTLSLVLRPECRESWAGGWAVTPTYAWMSLRLCWACWELLAWAVKMQNSERSGESETFAAISVVQFFLAPWSRWRCLTEPLLYHPPTRHVFKHPTQSGFWRVVWPIKNWFLIRLSSYI